jgi:hypothetical protein
LSVLVIDSDAHQPAFVKVWIWHWSRTPVEANLKTTNAELLEAERWQIAKLLEGFCPHCDGKMHLHDVGGGDTLFGRPTDAYDHRWACCYHCRIRWRAETIPAAYLWSPPS